VVAATMGVDGPAFEDQLASTVVAHRSCRAETNQWLTGRATPKERKRSKNVLLGLVPDDELAGATQAPAAERPSGSGTPPITLRGGQGRKLACNWFCKQDHLPPDQHH
jgi:hypothetical protein